MSPDITKNTANTLHDNKSAIVWYVMRTTYKRELKIEQILDEKGIACFVPVKKDNVNSAQKVNPIMENIIFIKSSRNVIDELKSSEGLLSSLRYIINMDTGDILIVPDAQMNNFILISSTLNDNLIYIPTSEIAHKTGDRYTITGGDYKGAVGEIIRVKGDRRFVVRIDGIIAVATAFIHPKYLQKLE